ncbi:hypothetical protein J6590_071814, partial [Homalodisca vitripennis]
MLEKGSAVGTGRSGHCSTVQVYSCLCFMLQREPPIPPKSREDLIKWLMEADLNADLNDDEIIEETPDSGKTDGDEIEVAASSFK